MTSSFDFLTSSFMMMVAIATWILTSIPLFVIATKTNQENSWFAFIPILNVILMLQVAGKDLWWVILLLVPIVNIIIMVIVWMGIAEAVNKPSWVGVLILVPCINWAVPWYLAFAP